MHAAMDNALGDGRTNRGRPMPASSGALRLPLASSGQCPAFCFRVSKTQEKTRRPCKLTAPHTTLPELQGAGLLPGTRTFAHTLPFASSALPHVPCPYTFCKTSSSSFFRAHLKFTCSQTLPSASFICNLVHLYTYALRSFQRLIITCIKFS